LCTDCKNCFALKNETGGRDKIMVIAQTKEK
jgi:hypothetical protein